MEKKDHKLFKRGQVVGVLYKGLLYTGKYRCWSPRYRSDEHEVSFIFGEPYFVRDKNLFKLDQALIRLLQVSPIKSKGGLNASI